MLVAACTLPAALQRPRCTFRQVLRKQRGRTRRDHPRGRNLRASALCAPPAAAPPRRCAHSFLVRTVAVGAAVIVIPLPPSGRAHSRHTLDAPPHAPVVVQRHPAPAFAARQGRGRCGCALCAGYGGEEQGPRPIVVDIWSRTAAPLHQPPCGPLHACTRTVDTRYSCVLYYYYSRTLDLVHVWRSSLVPAANRFQMDFLKNIFQQTNTVVFVTFWLLLRFRVRVRLYGCTAVQNRAFLVQGRVAIFWAHGPPYCTFHLRVGFSRRLRPRWKAEHLRIQLLEGPRPHPTPNEKTRL
eukprot:SAG25_NODE_354_length_9250_cov_2.824281_7_plen_296_part_00